MLDIKGKLEKKWTENVASSYQHPPYVLEQELAKYMSVCDREKSRELLQMINSLERANLAQSPLQSLRYSLICECTCYTRTVIRAGVDSEHAFNLSDVYIREIARSQSTAALFELEYAMLDDFIGAIEQAKKLEISSNPIVNRMILYIHANIHRHITLDDIAGEVHLHPAYVSALFRKETNSSISEFIAANKILAIKKFLVETDLKMLDIAEAFEFSSAAHFTMFFRKATGQTPREYRAANKADRSCPAES